MTDVPYLPDGFTDTFTSRTADVDGLAAHPDRATRAAEGREQ
jgi:muconolactone delta-isomerase